MSAEVTIDRLATGQVRIAMREGWGGRAGIARFSREEYLVDRQARSVTARRSGLL